MVDQNYLRVRKYFLLIFFLFFSSVSYSDDYSLTKVTKLDEPWGSTFISNDEIIVTEKDGKIKIVNINSKNTFEVKHNLNFLNVGQGGLLDIIYEDNYLWVSYSEDRGNGKTSTSIAKAVLNKDELNFKNIFQANPPIDSGYHFGSRLAIKGKYLYASAGERGMGMTEKAVDAYYEIANKHGLDLAQMSLKFLEIQPFVTSVIIGATTMEQLKTNIESVNINLSDDVIKEINNVQTIYPNPCP